MSASTMVEIAMPMAVRIDGNSLLTKQGANALSQCAVFMEDLVGWFWVYWPFETVFQSISGRLQKRGRKKKKREKTDEGKMSKQPEPAPTASAIGPCPTIIQTSRTPRH